MGIMEKKMETTIVCGGYIYIYICIHIWGIVKIMVPFGSLKLGPY